MFVLAEFAVDNADGAHQPGPEQRLFGEIGLEVAGAPLEQLAGGDVLASCAFRGGKTEEFDQKIKLDDIRF